MKTQLLLKNSLLLAAGLLLSSAAANAALYHASIDTSSLIGNPNAPFSLSFQLNGGDTPGNNSVTISNISFGGGSAGAAGTISATGDVTGNLGSSVNIANLLPFNEFYQEFTPGATIQFDFDVTQNLDGTTPDLFLVSIFGSSFDNITTTGFGDTLIAVNIDTTGSLTVGVGQGEGAYSGVTTTVSAVPEPSAALLGLVGGTLLLRRRRNR